MAKSNQLTFGLIVTDPDAYRQEQRRKGRRCLSCGETFLSAHAGNRLCGCCLGTADFQSPVTEYNGAF